MMMSRRRFVLTASIVMVMMLAAISSFAANKQAVVRIRIRDADNYGPLKGIHVALAPLNDEGRPTGTLNATTDKDGIASFHFGEPVPDRFDLILAPDEFALCSQSKVEYLTEEVVKRGVTSTGVCGSAHSHEATPGELVIFGKRITLWQRIWREIP